MIDDEEGDARDTPEARAFALRLAALEADPRVRAAALIGSEFGIDPVVVLDERDVLKRLVRLAAFNIVQTETAKANKRSK